MTALSSELSRRLSKAKELLENKKQKKALKNLWFAEALARGNAEALRAVLDVTTAFSERAEPRRKSDLAYLVEVLQYDIDTATRQAAAPPAETAQPTSLSPGGGVQVGCGCLLIAFAPIGAMLSVYAAIGLQTWGQFAVVLLVLCVAPLFSGIMLIRGAKRP